MATTPSNKPKMSIESEEKDLETLRKDHDRFRQIAEINQTVIWEVDKNGLYTYVSPKSEYIYGYSPEELVGTYHFYDLHPINKREQFRIDTMSAFASLQSFQDFRNQIQRKDGTIITVATNGVPFYNDSGSFAGYRGSDSDITDQIKIESKLNESHRLLENLTNQIPGVVYQFQRFQDGTSCFPYVSQGIIDIYGLTADQVQKDASEVFQRIHPDDVDRIIREVEESAANLSPFFSEFRVRIPGQEVSWRQCIANPELLFDGSVLWHGIIQNTNEKKLIEDELKLAFKHTKELQRALDSVPVAVFMKDLNSTYTYANSITRDVFDVTLEGLKEKNDFDFFDEMTAKELISIDKEVFKGNKTTREVRTVDLKGVERVYLEIKTPIYDDDFPDKIVGLLGVATDITSNKKSESIILESEQYLKSLIKAIPDTLFILDSDGVYLDYKADSKDLYILDGSFIGKKVSEVMPSELSAFVYSAIDESLNSSEVVERQYSLEVQGELRHYNSRFVSTEGNKIVVTVTDITESVKNLNRIKNLLSAEEEQNKRLRNFTHIVSHNLRSHTANMEGLLYLLEDEFPEMFNNQYIQLLNVSSGNLKDTIKHLNQVLDINLVGDKEWSKVNIRTRVDTEIQSVQQLINNAKIQIINEVDPSLEVEVIPAYLDSIVLNLLTNAIKYRSEEREPKLIITSNRENETLILKFTDNGLGIDLNRHGEKIFGMYKTFHSNNDSKGLGLFMVKNQIEAMGGHIEVASEVNVGTTFTIKLPLNHARM